MAACEVLTGAKMKHTKNKKAFTFVEILIGLIITGLLMAAVATAFHASLVNYEANQDIYKASNDLRQSLLRMTTQLRTATAVNSATANDRCTLITSTGSDITFQYVPNDSKIYLITNDDTSDADYTLCDNVTAATFTKMTDVDDLGATYVKTVEISITVSEGSGERTLSSAATLRKNLD